MMLGRHINLPADLEFGISFHEAVEKYSGEYVQDLRRRLLELHEIARRAVREASFQTKIRYDLKAKPVDYETGDQVSLYNPRETRGFTRKLQTNWEGPYTVVQRLTEVVVQIQRTPRSRIKTVHADRLRLIEKASRNLPIEFDEEIASKNMPGLRTRRMNARRKFPVLRITIKEGTPTTITTERRPLHRRFSDSMAKHQIRPRQITRQETEGLLRQTNFAKVSTTASPASKDFRELAIQASQTVNLRVVRTNTAAIPVHIKAPRREKGQKDSNN